MNNCVDLPARAETVPAAGLPPPDDQAAPAPTARDFKDVFRVHPAGVALITAATPTGPVGLTASSVASVNPDPPALSFSLTRAGASAAAILSAPTFVVHLLDRHDVEIATLYARSGAERFTAEQGWSELATGEPYLPSARAALRCRPITTVPVGGSELVIGEVLEVHRGRASSPVVYYDRRFHPLGEP